MEEETLGKIASALGVQVEAIKQFNEEAVFNIISNTFTDNSSNNNNYQCTFNPIEKIVELYDEKVALMERLLASEKEKVALMERVLKDRG